MSASHKVLSQLEWGRVRELFEHCLELNPEQRQQFLDQQTVHEPELRAEVESLLLGCEAPQQFLNMPLLKLPPTPVAPVVESKSFSLQLGKYFLFHRLGKGGMAEVFLAKVLGPTGLGRLVAVKKVLPHYAEDANFLRLFEQEAKLSSRLTHANVIHIYDFGNFEGSYLLVMEFVNGVNLADGIGCARQQGTVVPLDCALYIMSLVADALEYAHQRRDDITGMPLNIIHRDISPKNIMLSFEGDVKVVDFGIAKTQDHADFTKTGMMRGTIGYLSPEIVKGQPVDSRSDIFSACAVLYELIAGTKLVNSENLFVAIQQTQSENFIEGKINELPVDVVLKQILRRGLAQSATDRFEQAGVLRDELELYLKDHFTLGVKARLRQFLEAHYSAKISSNRAIIQQSGNFPELGIKSKKSLPSLKKMGLILFSVIAASVLLFLLGGVIRNLKTLNNKLSVHPRISPKSDSRK